MTFSWAGLRPLASREDLTTIRRLRSPGLALAAPRYAELPGGRVEFRRINGLPPYVFAAINQLRDEARHAGEDVIDLGFGNPDIPSPPIAVEKLAEAARNPRNHRYSSSAACRTCVWP